MSERIPPSGIGLVVVLFVLVNGLMLLVNGLDPYSFLRGDRSGSRMERIQYVYHGTEILHRSPDFDIQHQMTTFHDRVMAMKYPGDYLIQGVVYHAGGRPLVVALQLLLTALGCLAVFGILRLMALPPGWCLAGTAVYITLPGTILQPHTLMVEGLFIPGLLVMVYGVLRVLRGNWRPRHLVMATAGLGFAIAVRAQFFPLALALVPLLWVALRGQGRPRAWALLPLLATTPLLLWVGLSLAHSGTASIAPAGAGLGYHWNQRLERMQQHADFDYPQQDDLYEPVPTGDFLALVADHPVAYAKTLLSDNMNMFFNPGDMQLLKQIGLGEPPPSWKTFLAARDAGGIPEVLRVLAGWSMPFTVFFILHAGLWTLMAMAAGWQALQWMATPRRDTLVKVLLLGYLAYNLAIVQLAGTSRWGLRQPVEALVVVMALMTLWQWADRRRLWAPESTPARSSA